jgi:peptidoglycan/xylan/chitin deacetylase (PgdA/CDA1 family)
MLLCMSILYAALIILSCLWAVYDHAAAQPLAESDGTLRRIRVPVLMYHYVSPLPSDADAIRRDLTVEPDVFESHLRYLVEQGYETISLYQLYDALTRGVPLPPKPVVLTFDDGYRDHYDYVFPALRRYGLTGTFFIITGRADASDPAYLTWAEIAEMAQAGMSMEPHTKSHISLEGRNRDVLIYEMLGSHESLRAHTGSRAQMLSYPAGRYDDLTLQMADEIGFELAVTTEAGMHHTTSNTLELPRVRVSGETSAAGLHYLLGGSWLENK